MSSDRYACNVHCSLINVGSHPMYRTHPVLPQVADMYRQQAVVKANHTAAAGPEEGEGEE